MQSNKLFKFIISILCLTYLNCLSAEENITGLWIGNLSLFSFSEQEEKQLGDIYISIHQNENDLVLVILTAVEKTGDLYASTYIGTGTLKEDENVHVLTVYGDNAYFPDWNSINNSLIYVENPYNLWLRTFDDGRSAELIRDSGTANLKSFVLLKKLL